MKTIVRSLVLGLLWTLMPFVPFAFSQQDVKLNPGRSPYVTLAKGATWGGSGVGGVNNYYIFPPINPDQRYCLFIVNNNPTSAHTYTLAAYQTGDPSTTAYSTQTGRWILDTVQGNAGTVAAASMTSAYVHASAAAWAMVSITSASTQSGSPDTADIYIVQTTSESCGPVQQGVPQTGAICPLNAPGRLNANLTPITMISAPSAGQFIYICSVSIAGTNGTAGHVDLIPNANACSNTTTDSGYIFSIYAPASAAVIFSQAFNNWKVQQNQANLCAIASGGTPVFDININYAIQ